MGKGLSSIVEAVAKALEKGGSAMFNKYAKKIPDWGIKGVQSAKELAAFVREHPAQAVLIASGIADQTKDLIDLLVSDDENSSDKDVVALIEALRKKGSAVVAAHSAHLKTLSEIADAEEATLPVMSGNKLEIMEVWEALKVAGLLSGIQPSRYERDYATKIVQFRKQLQLFMEVREDDLYDLAELYSRARTGQ